MSANSNPTPDEIEDDENELADCPEETRSYWQGGLVTAVFVHKGYCVVVESKEGERAVFWGGDNGRKYDNLSVPSHLVYVAPDPTRKRYGDESLLAVIEGEDPQPKDDRRRRCVRAILNQPSGFVEEIYYK